jgi:NADPH-dependent curcumin reductase CurA
MPQMLNETMGGATVGEVVESRSSQFAVGDTVRGMLGWGEYGVSKSEGIAKVDSRHIPLSAYLGVVGMPGMTAWYGYNKIMEPKAGETVVVSAASGAVGSVVGQLARIAGVRVVGIAGGPDKCRYVTQELGFDACVDYKSAADAKALAALIAAAAPKGVDAHFENVGGDVLNAVMTLLNPFARVAICGLIADYNMTPGSIPKSAILNPGIFLVARFKMQGFIISDHLNLWPEGLSALGGLVVSGKLKYKETIAEGLAAAPAAFIGMLKGHNFGKQLVRLY